MELGDGFEAGASEPRLAVARGNEQPELIDCLPSPPRPAGSPAAFAFGVDADVIEDPDASFALMLDDQRTALPRPTPTRVGPAASTLEEKLKALRQELHDTRARLEIAEQRADEAYWNQLAAEERNAKARAAAHDETARADELQAALELAREEAAQGQALSADEVGRLQTELELVQESAAQMEMELQRALAEVAGGADGPAPA